MQMYVFFGLLFAFVVAIFAVQNATPVDIDFLFWQLRGISLSLVVLGSVLAGALIALVLGLARQYRMARRIKELTADLAEYELGKKAGTPEPDDNRDQTVPSERLEGGDDGPPARLKCSDKEGG